MPLLRRKDACRRLEWDRSKPSSFEDQLSASDRAQCGTATGRACSEQGTSFESCASRRRAAVHRWEDTNHGNHQTWNVLLVSVPQTRPTLCVHVRNPRRWYRWISGLSRRLLSVEVACPRTVRMRWRVRRGRPPCVSATPSWRRHESARPHQAAVRKTDGFDSLLQQTRPRGPVKDDIWFTSLSSMLDYAVSSLLCF